MIFWFFGLPGIGKDYCAQIFSTLFDAKYIHLDDFLLKNEKTKLLKGTFTTKDRLNKLKRATVKIDKFLLQNKSVVVADSLPDHESRAFLRSIFKKNIIFILVEVSAEVHKKRLVKRKDHFFTINLLNDWIIKHWEKKIEVPYIKVENNQNGKREITAQLKRLFKKFF